MLAVGIYARAMCADKLRCDPVTYACFAKKELSVSNKKTPNAGYACRHLVAAKGKVILQTQTGAAIQRRLMRLVGCTNSSSL